MTTIYVVISGGVCQNVVFPPDGPDLDYVVLDFDDFDDGPLEEPWLERAKEVMSLLERDIPDEEVTTEWRDELRKQEDQ